MKKKKKNKSSIPTSVLNAYKVKGDFGPHSTKVLLTLSFVLAAESNSLSRALAGNRMG